MFVKFWSRHDLVEGEEPADIVKEFGKALKNNPLYCDDEYEFLRRLFKAIGIYAINQSLAGLTAEVVEADTDEQAQVKEEESTRSISQRFDSVDFAICRLEEQGLITPTHLLAFGEILDAVKITHVSDNVRDALDAAREELGPFVPPILL